MVLGFRGLLEECLGSKGFCSGIVGVRGYRILGGTGGLGKNA